MTAVLRFAALAALVACHYHRDLNAPGLIDPAVPPVNIDDPTLELPGDPGERMIVLTTGGLVGVSGGSIASAAAIDLGIEATVSWGETAVRHNDHQAGVLLPRGVLLPLASTGVTLGWSGLRIVSQRGESTEVSAGAIYAQLQHSFLFGTVAAGWAVDPTTGATGPQLDGSFTFFYLRGRVLFGDGGGWELGGGIQVKIPNTWVWSR